MNKEQQLKCVEIALRDTKVIRVKNAPRLYLCSTEYIDPSKYHLIIFVSFIYHLLQGYYRDSNDKQTVSLGACKRCQCSGHESDCFQVLEIKSSSLEIYLSSKLFNCLLFKQLCHTFNSRMKRMVNCNVYVR